MIVAHVDAEAAASMALIGGAVLMALGGRWVRRRERKAQRRGWSYVATGTVLALAGLLGSIGHDL